MDTSIILDRIYKNIFTRRDVFYAASSTKEDFKESDMRNLMEAMIVDGSIVRIAHNVYVRKGSNKQEYSPVYSDEANKIIVDVKEKFPYLNFQVWEITWLNEFLNHLVSHNRIFLDVENDGCEFVYTSLSDDYSGKMLLRPSVKELQYYLQTDSIIIERLISESPKGKNNAYETPIEKIIVEMFANKTLISMISKGDYPEALETIFEKYNIDQTKMLRYARRRNKKNELIKYIKDHTSIKLLGED
ncbi:DUF6577 family protein [Oribacterium sp. NK2B42]|uniref:DUF6577 family protein n=1 Tax=Oribacterium sp. NK2B42 TaxID=689781 RepID=UPI0003FC3F88|nr:DUF6577 family protein [Oribacterium sp. NK2B42]